LRKLWSTKEERRTISGCIKAASYTSTDVYDPICDNCYALYELTDKEALYLPRLGHIGNKKGKGFSDTELQQFYADSNKNFNLARPVKYLIA
jgi:hypothetical protein